MLDHQERSADTFDRLKLKEDPFKRNEVKQVWDEIYVQMRNLGMWQILNYLDAKKDKKNGGEGLMHSVTFDN
jgi:hypothetical protein